VPRGTVFEIVERQQITGFFQPTASLGDFIVGLDRLENLDDHAILGQEIGEVTQPKTASAIEECFATAGEALNAEKEQIVGCGGRCYVESRAAEAVFASGAEQKFVAVNGSISGEDRLASEKCLQIPSPSPLRETDSIGKGKCRNSRPAA
jgi:hypothetical protein